MQTMPMQQARVRVLHPIHASLIRPALFLGVDQSVAMLEGMILFGLLVGVGLHLATLALAGMVMGLHTLLVWLTAQDPLITRVYLRTLSLKDYYTPAAPVRSRTAPVRPSIPLVR
jgi:type IV secretory pathway TrbD component